MDIKEPNLDRIPRDLVIVSFFESYPFLLFLKVLKLVQKL